MSQQLSATRTQLLFTGVTNHVSYDPQKQLVTFQMRDDRISYTIIDENCNIQAAAIDSAFAALQDTPLVTIITPFDLLTNIPLTDKKLLTVKRLFCPAHKWIQLTFAGSDHDANKLRRNAPVQIYAVNLNLPCPKASAAAHEE